MSHYNTVFSHFRKFKGAIKLHVGLSHAGYLPEFVTVTEGKDHDVTIGRTLKFSKGSIVVIDKGYTDYAWYQQLTIEGVYFVTRIKINAKYRVVERRPVLKEKGLTCDQTIQLTGTQASKKCSVPLRRIGYRETITGKHYFFSRIILIYQRTLLLIFIKRAGRWSCFLNGSNKILKLNPL